MTLTPEEETLLTPTRQVNTEAYEACLKGQFSMYKYTPSDLKAALQYFELALEKDPDYARAHVGVASVWGYRSSIGVVPPSEASPQVKAALLRAIELDDKLAEAHYALAQMKAYLDWDWEGAETSFLRAIELNPNYAEVRAGYSGFLSKMGRLDEAMIQTKRALELDPLASTVQVSYARRLLNAGRIDDAIEQYRKVLRTDPHHQGVLQILPTAFYLKGMYEEAYEAQKVQAAYRGGPEAVAALERGYEEGGFAGAMRRLAERRVKQTLSGTGFPSPVVTAQMFVMAGEKQQALDWLELACEQRHVNITGIGKSPVFKGLRDEPRFHHLLRRMNFPEDVIARILEDTK